MLFFVCSNLLSILWMVLCKWTNNLQQTCWMDWYNGLFDFRYPMDTTATFTCSEGYELVGSSTRTCNPSGDWTSSTPECREKGDHKYQNTFMWIITKIDRQFTVVMYTYYVAISWVITWFKVFHSSIYSVYTCLVLLKCIFCFEVWNMGTNFFFQWLNLMHQETSIHSSRMRTTRLLTIVSRGCLPRVVCLGVCVSQHAMKQTPPVNRMTDRQV